MKWSILAFSLSLFSLGVLIPYPGAAADRAGLKDQKPGMHVNRDFLSRVGDFLRVLFQPGLHERVETSGHDFIQDSQV